MDRTVDRYTSPDLSRQLAEAGLEQKVDGDFYCEMRGLVRLTLTERNRDEWNAEDASSRYSFGDHIRCAHYTRAIDLTDVLEELTRDREGGPLTKYVTLINTQLGEWRLSVRDGIVAYEKWGGTPVEAAGLILLALLRERGGK